MVMRCILGCSPPQTLFPIPKVPWLRVRWLQFLHFDDGGVTENTRLCARHFTQDSFKNFRQHEMGFVKLLLLSDTAVPCVYTVGASPGAKPLTRDVGCQCSPTPVKKSTAVQATRSTPKPKRRSKAVQVKPPILSIGMSCLTEHPGPGLDETCSPKNKRPRVKEEDGEMEESGSSCTEESTAAASDLTYQSEDSDTSLCAAHYYDGSADWEYLS
ncbi:uncharacterized protein LOC120474117 [Pimephales promelas]|uniref:uncharacterized protein LOC120474117 n=1 Tax=Pimephales promelas TaxID=90988 RepID=UPI001955A217|nr:uncharacterized protein LOC120474117 [Pimephales promelas]KAG1929552.1 transcription factor Sp3 [Pimephales promelas]